MSDPNTLGSVVRKRRLESGYSLGQLASKVGKTAAEVRAWERDNELPEHGILERLAETLELDLADIQKQVAAAQSAATKSGAKKPKSTAAKTAAKKKPAATAKKAAAAKGAAATGERAAGADATEEAVEGAADEAKKPAPKKKPASRAKKPPAKTKKAAGVAAGESVDKADTKVASDSKGVEASEGDSDEVADEGDKPALKKRAAPRKPDATKGKKPAAKRKKTGAATGAAVAAAGTAAGAAAAGAAAGESVGKAAAAGAVKKAGAPAKKAGAEAREKPAPKAGTGSKTKKGAVAAAGAIAGEAAVEEATGTDAVAAEEPPTEAELSATEAAAEAEEPADVEPGASTPDKTESSEEEPPDLSAAEVWEEIEQEDLPGFSVDDPFTPPPADDRDSDVLDAPTEAVPVPVITNTAAAARAQRAAAVLEQPPPPLPMVEAAPDADPGLLRYLEPLRVLYDPNSRYLYWIRSTLTVIVMTILAVVFFRMLGDLLDAVSQLLDTIEPSTPSPDDLNASGAFSRVVL